MGKKSDVDRRGGERFLLEKKEIARKEDGEVSWEDGRGSAVSDPPRQILSGPDHKKLAGQNVASPFLSTFMG